MMVVLLLVLVVVLRYHMFGEDVRRLHVLLLQAAVSLVFQKEGNYGDSWNYGQVTLNLTTDTTVGGADVRSTDRCCSDAECVLCCGQVVFEALKRGGIMNDIALDDIALTPGPCGPDPPEPTNVPPPTAPPVQGCTTTTLHQTCLYGESC